MLFNLPTDELTEEENLESSTGIDCSGWTAAKAC
jgi:hypothetical protein